MYQILVAADTRHSALKYTLAFSLEDVRDTVKNYVLMRLRRRVTRVAFAEILWYATSRVRAGLRLLRGLGADISVGSVSAAAVSAIIFTGAAPANARPVRGVARTLQPPAFAYSYDGIVYDRLFGALYHPARASRTMGVVVGSQSASLPGAPYAITDLAPIAETGFTDTPNAGYPLAINDSGLITYVNLCGCIDLGYGYGEDVTLIVNDSRIVADISVKSGSEGGYEDPSGAYPYAINRLGFSAGQYYSYYGEAKYEGNEVWTPAGGLFYYGANDFGSFALAINDANVSVGQDSGGAKGTYAVAYSLRSNGYLTRVPLLPPKGTSWVGTATGINDAGEIVGFEILPKGAGGRAVRFYQNGPAQVLPVGATGASTSAQAINVYGDVIGNAGSQAYLYKNNRVTYLPRPPGETAGNAVAYAINASDEIVGDIVTATGSTAFLYVNGKSYDLNSLLAPKSGWTITHAAGINDAGQIIGNGNDAAVPAGGSFSMKPTAP